MATEACSTYGFWQFVGQAITIVVGWVVVHRLSITRDRDKARREIVARTTDSLSDNVDTLLIDAQSYHLSSRAQDCEIKIKMNLQDISVRLGSLTGICAHTNELVSCRSLVINLRQAITSQHFEDEHQDSLFAGNQQIQDIAAAALRLKQALLHLKHCQFSTD